MSASPAPALTAIAFQLAAALERYQMHFDELTDPWSHKKLYELVRREFNEIRMLKGALPELSVAMVEVLICHAQLMATLWQYATPDKPADGDVADLRRRHRDAVARMRERCLRVFSRR